MVALAVPNRLKLPHWPVLVAIAAGLVVAGTIGALPERMLERAVMESGIASVVTAAEPPLGMTARVVLALMGGAVAGGGAIFAAFMLMGMRAFGASSESSVRKVSVRRADAHPDAPPREPLLATRDLGAPMPEIRNPEEGEPLELSAPVEVESEGLALPPPDEPMMPAGPPPEQALPDDLDLLLASFDPAAVPAEPAQPVRMPPPLRRTPQPAALEEGERIETFELTPMRRAAPERADFDAPPVQPAEPEPFGQEEPMTRPETDATIHALLERLERGIGRRTTEADAPAPARHAAEDSAKGLEATLDSLRRLAQNG